MRLRWLHFFLASHVHDALRATGGLRGAFDVSLLRKANQHPCYANESDNTALSLLPSPQEPLLPGMEHVCGARRGIISCAAESLRCALDRGSA